MNLDVEKSLENLKKDYLLTKIPRDLEEKGLFNVLENLKKQKTERFKYFWPTSIAFLTIISLFLSFGWTQVEAALPGENLYPVKKLSEELFAKISGNSQIKVENRAQEVFDLVEKNEKSQDTLDQAAQDYQKEVENTQKEIKPEKRQDFDKKLENYENELKKIIIKSPPSKESLKKAVEVTEKARKENKENSKAPIKPLKEKQK